MLQVRYFAVTEEHNGQRVDNFLLRELKGVPRMLLYRLLRTGQVRINKKRCKPLQRLNMGDTIRVAPIRLGVAKTPSNVQVHHMEQAIIYEDDDLIVLNKPCGYASHGGSGLTLGVVEVLRQIRPLCKFLYLVHRLDKDTSGCLMIAKRRRVLVDLQQLIQQRKVRKDYTVLVHGRWASSLKRVALPLVKQAWQDGRYRVVVAESGKPSVTLFQEVQYFDGFTLLKARLLTGRTHQIRVHCQYHGCPIVGDYKYGSSARDVKSMLLHATALRFPYQGDELRVTAPMPAYFQNHLAKLAVKA